MRIIVIAAGEGTRWGNHTGVPKHLAVLDGERLIDRIARLFSPHGEVIVVGPDDRYHAPGAGLWRPTITPSNGDADKFLSSRELWSRTTRTVIVYGDCFYSGQAAKTIATDRSREWRMFGRVGPSSITNKPWGEPFAWAFDPGDHAGHDAALRAIVNLRRAGKIKRNGGWEWYRQLEGLPLKLRPNRVGPHFVEIDDLTDDLDFPIDFERQVAALERAKVAA